jgi:hypothetical protein
VGVQNDGVDVQNGGVVFIMAEEVFEKVLGVIFENEKEI